MTRLYIGIDPGKSGGVAFIRGRERRACKMPAVDHDLWDLLVGNDPATVVIEKVASSPQMGVRSAFTFGHSAGLIRGVCIAAGLQMEYVTPQQWQKHYGLIVHGRKLGRGDTDKKNRNKSKAKELFPELKITHSIADALLLAEYGRRLGL